ncbi:MAG: homoserine kinase [Lachnospiraceae bacterium]|nr:homoserine kinase [Lachnospiraceae bacterium]
MITVRVPASSANLGPGFDCMGLALTIYNYFDVKEYDGLFIEGVDDAYKGEDNLFYKAFQKGIAYRLLKSGKQATAPYGIHIRIRIGVPMSRGLGSSANCIIGGLAAANELYPSIPYHMTEAELFYLGNEMEGHPDNIAPALFGGFTSSMILPNNQPVKMITPVSPKWYFAALVPDVEVPTKEARKALPDTLHRTEAALNVSHALFIQHGIKTADPAILKAAGVDYIHEPYRKKLIPDYETVKELAAKAGCEAFFISGSGSTCLALSLDPQFATRLQSTLVLANLTANWEVYSCEPDISGVTILR